jgi:hypothetical protein
MVGDGLPVADPASLYSQGTFLLEHLWQGSMFMLAHWEWVVRMDWRTHVEGFVPSSSVFGSCCTQCLTSVYKIERHWRRMNQPCSQRFWYTGNKCVPFISYVRGGTPSRKEASLVARPPFFRFVGLDPYVLNQKKWTNLPTDMTASQASYGLNASH